MKIPVENIYYLLCYAWDKLDEKDIVKVDVDESTEILDLLTKIMINGTKHILKRGIDKNYIETKEELSGVKGKLDLSATIKENLLLQKKTNCVYDEYSTNILHNQIIKTTLNNLKNTKNLDKNLRIELHKVLFHLPQIDLLKLNYRTFDKVELNRNNYFYEFILHVCRIVFDHLLIDESKGEYWFKNFFDDEEKMRILFENFVRNFYKKEQNEYRVKRDRYKWKFSSNDWKSNNHLPYLETDISLESKEQKIIIDTKFTKSIFYEHWNKEILRNEHLFQIFAYLLNQENDDEKTKSCEGILLYPVTKEEVSLNYTFQNHTIRIETVDLNQNWKSIDRRLKEIIDV